MPLSLARTLPAPKFTIQPDESKPLVVVPPAALGPALMLGLGNGIGFMPDQSRISRNTIATAPPSSNMFGVMVRP